VHLFGFYYKKTLAR